MDAIDTGIGQLVDADMPRIDRFQALRCTQLGVQAPARIVEQQILQLFQG
jgi:hypothetical protein